MDEKTRIYEIVSEFLKTLRKFQITTRLICALGLHSFYSFMFELQIERKRDLGAKTSMNNSTEGILEKRS